MIQQLRGYQQLRGCTAVVENLSWVLTTQHGHISQIPVCLAHVGNQLLWLLREAVLSCVHTDKQKYTHTHKQQKEGPLS